MDKEKSIEQSSQAIISPISTQRTNKSNVIIIGAVVIVLLVEALSFCFIGSKQASKDRTSNLNTPSSLTQKNNWITYTNTRYSYKVKYPSNLTIGVGHKFERLIEDFPSVSLFNKDLTCCITLFDNDKSEIFNLEVEYDVGDDSDMKDYVYNRIKWDQKSAKTIKGFEYVRYPNVESDEVYYYINNNNVIYRIYGTNIKLIDEIFSTITFDNNKTVTYPICENPPYDVSTNNPFIYKSGIGGGIASFKGLVLAQKFFNIYENKDENIVFLSVKKQNKDENNDFYFYLEQIQMFLDNKNDVKPRLFNIGILDENNILESTAEISNDTKKKIIKALKNGSEINLSITIPIRQPYIEGGHLTSDSTPVCKIE